MLLLEQNIIRKMQINKFLLMSKFETGNNKKYEVEIIWDSVVYSKKAVKHLLRLYYWVV